MPSPKIPQSALLALAHRLRAYGFSLLPVDRTTKRPLVPWKVYQARHPTDAELAAWFATGDANVGVVTGAISNLVAVDFDDAEDVAARMWAEQLPPTPMACLSGGGGLHLYFTHPGRHVPTKGRVRGMAVDIRGDGGVIIAPGSWHANGQRYRAPEPWPETLAAVPVFDRAWVAEARAVPSPEPPRVPGVSACPMRDRAAKYLAAIPPPEIGSGSDAATLYAACRLVRGFALSAAETEDLLWDWAGQRDGWDRRWVAEKVAHATRYGTEPVGGLLR